jgi:glycosyltransferase involved in cell wall biosynthesis
MHSYRPDIMLLPNPIELSKYCFRLRNHPEAKLVWLRAFHKIYNPSLAPKVLALLMPDLPKTSLLMIGPSKSDGSLESVILVASSLGVRANLKLAARVPKAEISDWLNKGDVFINTTNIDNTPISILEAMACGLCIVSTNVGGLPYLLADGHDALLVPPDNPEAMAEAVRRILNDPVLATRLSRNAREKVEQFDWSIILPKWQSMFTTIENGESFLPQAIVPVDLKRPA